MLTIPHIEEKYTKNNYNNSYCISKNKIHSPNFKNLNEKLFNLEGYYYPVEPDINQIIKTGKRPLSRTSTLNKIDEVFSNYEKSLNKISLDDINIITNNLEKNTKYSRQEILNTMQKTTQFGNLKSIRIIEKELNKHNIGYLINNKNPLSKSNIDLNTTLNYFFEQKKLGYLNGEKIGIILDKNKIEELESLQKTSPDIFEKNKNNVSFFILSGFNNGINFINREKNIENTTKTILTSNKDIDSETIERCKKLGIKPTLIKNENIATEENIYKQLKPQEMTKDQLLAIIDANVMFRIPKKEERIDAKEPLVEYLNNNLNVYTPERLSKNLKLLYNKLNETMKEKNGTMDDIIYIIPNSIKSYIPINYMYQQINNINKNKFIHISNIPKLNNFNKTFVIIDDCTLSGESIEDVALDLRQSNNNDIIYAPIYTSLIAENEIGINIYKNHRENKEKLIKIDEEKNFWNKNIEDPNNYLNKLLGDNGFENGFNCIIFPYMSPDNNSEFAGNISLLHHINYDKNDISNLKKYKSIKEFSPDNVEIAKLTEKLLEKDTK